MMGSLDCQVKLPVVDFTKEDLRPGTDSWISTREVVRLALEEFGCFILEYNKASDELWDELLDAMKAVFALPTEIKMKNKYDGKPASKGYVGQYAHVPLHESLGIDDAIHLEEVQKFSNLMWPTGNNKFCKYVYQYAKLAEAMDQMVTRMIFESYGVDKYYETYVSSTSYLLRLLSNRPPKGDETNLGFVNHTDKSFTTILHQFHINALEVETKKGDWIKVDFSSPTSYVVIAGDALMAWSNDRIQSPVHRVVMNADEKRYSLALFAFNKGILQVPQELVDDEHPLKYKPFNHLGLLNLYYKGHMKEYCGV